MLPLPTTRSMRAPRSRSAPVEADQLAHAQAGGVEQLEQGAVAAGERLVPLRRLQQGLDLARAQVAGEVAAVFGVGIASAGLAAIIPSRQP